LFKVEINTSAIEAESYEKQLKKYMEYFNINRNDASYFLGDQTVSTDTYSPADDNINILLKNGEIQDIADASDMLNITVLTKQVEKHFFCYHKL
jgi:hypothetical protein